MVWRGRRETDRKPAKVISLDEMWTPYQVRGRLYVGVRRKDRGRCEAWIWTAVIAEPDGRRWVDFEVGDRSETTFLRLYDRLPEAEFCRSDAYTVYDWLPANRHLVGKEPAPGLNRGSAVNRNEGLHSRWRDRLKRLQRKTKGYTKSVAMLRGSIALVGLWLSLI